VTALENTSPRYRETTDQRTRLASQTGGYTAGPRLASRSTNDASKPPAPTRHRLSPPMNAAKSVSVAPFAESARLRLLGEGGDSVVEHPRLLGGISRTASQGVPSEHLALLRGLDAGLGREHGRAPVQGPRGAAEAPRRSQVRTSSRLRSRRSDDRTCVRATPTPRFSGGGSPAGFDRARRLSLRSRPGRPKTPADR